MRRLRWLYPGRPSKGRGQSKGYPKASRLAALIIGQRGSSEKEKVMSNNEFDPYEAVIVDLESKIAALRATIENLQSVRSLVSQLPATGTGNSHPSGAGAFSHDAFFGMTVAEAAKKYLSAIKRTASSNVIGEALLAGGWKTSAKNIPETVRSILGRQPEFVRINGEFGLAEWYPGRKVKQRRSSSADSEVEAESSPIEAPTHAVPGE